MAERREAWFRRYDAPDEDYQAYWTHRRYEHEAELIALDRLIPAGDYTSAADIGGGYGRLTHVLLDRAQEVTLIEPSRKLVGIAEDTLIGHDNLRFSCRAAHSTGLADASLDLLIMVRVLHHLPDPTDELAELARVLRPGGVAVIEVANLAHAANRIRYRRRGERIPQSPVDLRSEARRAEDGIPFVNHHPATLRRHFTEAGLQVESTLSVSNLRSSRIKRVVPRRLMLSAERRLQRPLAPLTFGPSLFHLVRKPEA